MECLHGGEKSKIDIGIFIAVAPEHGGAFQYALMILDAAATLPKERYNITVYYGYPTFEPLIRSRGFTRMVLIKTEFVLYSIRAVLSRLKTWMRRPSPSKAPDSGQSGGSSTKEKILKMMRPIRDYISAMSIARDKPDILINAQQTVLHLPDSIQQVSPIHDLMHRYEGRFPEAGSSEQRAARDAMYAYMVNHCAAIITDSHVGSQHVIECYGPPQGKIYILPFTAPQCLLWAHPERPRNLPHHLDKNYLFYPAQFWRHKNHANLIRAIHQLREEIDIECVFVGSENKNGYHDFIGALKELGMDKKVTHLGYVNDSEMSWLYRHARCMVMPTFFGPTNIPPLEAMYFDCPVAVSGIYGMPEQLSDAALYFDPESAASIAGTIRTIWSDEDVRQTLIKNGRDLCQRVSPDSFKAQFRQIIAEMSGLQTDSQTA